MKCPYCGGETDANRPFCKNCGKRIDSFPAERMPTGQAGGERLPYGPGRGNNPSPYPGSGKESRSRGDIFMIVIGVVLALTAVGVALFILTHMVGDGNTVKKRDSVVSTDTGITESKKTESNMAAAGVTESEDSGMEVLAPSGDAPAEPTSAPTPGPAETALSTSYSCGSMPGEIASLFKVTITGGEASSELHHILL